MHKHWFQLLFHSVIHSSSGKPRACQDGIKLIHVISFIKMSRTRTATPIASAKHTTARMRPWRRRVSHALVFSGGPAKRNRIDIRLIVQWFSPSTVVMPWYVNPLPFACIILLDSYVNLQYCPEFNIPLFHFFCHHN